MVSGDGEVERTMESNEVNLRVCMSECAAAAAASHRIISNHFFYLIATKYFLFCFSLKQRSSDEGEEKQENKRNKIDLTNHG